MIHRIQAAVQSGFGRFQPSSNQPTDNKFGTFAGVFTPTVLTILGAIMYLRLGQVVGNAGLGGAIIIILLAHVITVSTGLAVSSIVTNTRVGAGGAFAIISQSLGLEVGGSIGLPLFMAQSISVALYVLAFGEAWRRIFSGHSYPLVCVISFVVVFLIAYRSAQFAARIQFIILAIVALSLVSIALGAFPMGDNPGLTQAPQLWGSFRLWDFWQTFAIFFPAVTGIMVGISMSGTLRRPRQSIPKGTMIAVFLTMAIYLLLAYWAARIATPEELSGNQTIMVDKAFWGWAILAGMLGATFSSALGSLVAAPRVMQAQASYNLVPFSRAFAQETPQGEPRLATILTGGIGFVALLVALSIGGEGEGGALDAIAEVITMFFLITYGSLNLVVLVEQTLGMVSFRPTFRVPRLVPFIGLVGCLFVMFLVNPAFSLVAMVLVLALFILLTRRKLHVTQNDVRSGLFISLAEWATKLAKQMPSAPERAWKPVALAPVRSTAELNGSFRFLRALTKPQGTVHALGIYGPGTKAQLDRLETLAKAFEDEGITAEATFLEDDSFVRGVRAATQVLRRTFFRPNLLFINAGNGDMAELQTLVNDTAAYDMAIVLLARHPVMNMGREKYINVWVSAQEPAWEFNMHEVNLDMAILTAVQLTRNWNGRITLCMAITNPDARPEAAIYLQRLVNLARLPQPTNMVILEGAFYETLPHAPEADLSIFGLPQDANLAFTQQVFELVNASCIFVRDSGEESAFA